MQENNRLKPGIHIWQQTTAMALVTGLLAGLSGLVLPESVFYEAARYYSGYFRPAEEMQLLDSLKNMQYIEYFVYFFCMRFLIPFAVILAGLLKKGIFLLQFYVIIECLAYAVQGVLIFGAGGMEGILINLQFSLFSEICYMMAAILAFCQKKNGVYSIKQYILTGIKAALALCCGAAAEFYLFCCFQR